MPSTDPLISSPSPDEHLSFIVGSESYAIPLEKVDEVIRMQRITPIPDTPEWVRGVINLRGTIVPVIDLREQLGMEPRADEARTCILVLHGDSPIGLAVDSVQAVIPLPADDVLDTRSISPIDCTIARHEAVHIAPGEPCCPEAPVLDALRVPALLLDAEGRVTHANRQAQRALHRSLRGRTLTELLGLDVQPEPFSAPAGAFTVHIAPLPSGFLVQLDRSNRVAALQALARGTPVDELDNQGDDLALVQAINTVIRRHRDLMAAVETLAEGQVLHSRSRHPDDAVMRALDRISDRTAALIDTAAQLHADADTVLHSGNALSDEASRSAASIRQISATVKRVAAESRTRVAQASRAQTLAERAQESALRGDAQMREVHRSMAAIAASDRNIETIIEVIDDIAFQTNLLALNATVEAGRAGVHGRGFARVAEDVRRLAGRSAEATRETTDLIRTSLRNLAEGQDVLAQSSEALSAIVDSVGEASELIAEITHTARAHALLTSQVDEALEQADGEAQSNANQALQIAGIAQQLAERSSSLDPNLSGVQEEPL